MGITALGTEKGLETRLVPERGYELALIPAVPLPRRPTPELITVPGRLRGTIKAAEQILERTKADCVVGFGGYVALPGYLAAKRLGVPIVVHEANARPGLANKIGSRYAHAVAVSTPDSKLRDARYIGIPLRRTIATLDRAAVRPEARHAFGLDQNLPTLLVSGGSQGARRLNEVVTAVAPRLQQSGVQILHAVGPKNELPAVRQHARHAAVPPGAVRGPDGPRVRRRRHDALPGRRHDRRRTVRRRTARRLRPAADRQRRAAAQRAAGGQGGRRTARRRRRADARLGARATCCPCSPIRTGSTTCRGPPRSSAAGTRTTCSSAWCTRRWPLGDASRARRPSPTRPAPGPPAGGASRAVPRAPSRAPLPAGATYQGARGTARSAGHRQVAEEPAARGTYRRGAGNCARSPTGGRPGSRRQGAPSGPGGTPEAAGGHTPGECGAPAAREGTIGPAGTHPRRHDSGGRDAPPRTTRRRPHARPRADRRTPAAPAGKHPAPHRPAPHPDRRPPRPHRPGGRRHLAGVRLLAGCGPTA